MVDIIVEVSFFLFVSSQAPLIVSHILVLIASRLQLKRYFVVLLNLVEV